jgi:hypothetical protein
MSKKDRPLPQPPKRPFQRRRTFQENSSEEPLLADELMRASAKGTLEELMTQELPDSEYSKKLVELLMGLTGMMPPVHNRNHDQKDRKSTFPKDRTIPQETEPRYDKPPEDIQQAVQSGDIKLIMELLYREHKKRMPDSDSKLSFDKHDHQSQNAAVVNKNLFDQMISIAADHNVSQEWLLMRAMRLYIDEYNRTGRL